MTRSNDLKLKGCPLCGAKMTIVRSDYGPEISGFVHPDRANCLFDGYYFRPEDAGQWNTRHTPDREAVAKLLCEISDDDWKQGKRFWRCQADRVLALMEGKQ